MTPSFHHLFFVNRHSFSADRQQSHEEHHRSFAWVWYCTMVLGLWLIAGPSTFGYVRPEMIWNDILSGLLMVGLSYAALKPYRLWARWGILFLGLWLLVAPMIFWSEEEAGLLTGFLAGTLAILFCIIIPGQPGIRLFAPPGPDSPPGWSYNPASWDQRIPVIFLAWIGFFISRYMGAFQLGYIDIAWDPFFGEGTRRVLDSEVSRSFPVSDATLGAFAYLLDVLFGAAGGIDRWRTMPWVVIIFGILIIPLGIVSITLIILQPLAVGYWCTLCLASALISLTMIPFAIDEVVATLRMMRHEKRVRGTAYRTTFWFGGSMKGAEGTTNGEPAADEGGPPESEGVQPKERGIPDKGKTQDPADLISLTLKNMSRDLRNLPWNLLVTTGIGIWTMFAPDVLGLEGTVADSCHLTGALVVSVSVISMSEVARTVRFLQILFGLWLAAAPWILGGPQAAIWDGMISGILLVLLSIPGGKRVGSRGTFDRHDA